MPPEIHPFEKTLYKHNTNVNMNFKESSIMAVPEINTTTPKIKNPVYEGADPKDPAKIAVDKIFTIFDPKGTGRITDDELDEVDKKDGKAADQFISPYDKTLSVFDLRKAAHPDAKLKPNDANKAISQHDFAELLGGQNPGEINVTISKDAAIKHLAANGKDLKTIQDFLAGKVPSDDSSTKKPTKYDYSKELLD